MGVRQMSNSEIAQFFKELADYLEIKGDNPFRIRAYRNAARTIETSGYDFAKLVEEGYDLSQLPDIGERIAKKIVEIVTTGKLSKLEEVKKEFPPHILDLLKIEGLGPKKVKTLYEKLGIGSLEELKKAAEEHKIRELPGFGEKTEEKILKGVVLYKKEGKRFLFAEAEPYASELYEYLKGFKAIHQLTIAGSFRRRKETVGDLDIVSTSDDPLGAMDHFASYGKIKEIVSKGDTRSTIILENNLQVDFRCVSDLSYGAALHYFTGSKAHNIAVRKMAVEKGWKVNEYGVFNEKMERIAGKTEEEIYRLFGMDYIEPELREDRGELEAAMEGKLPKLVTAKELRGDWHLRTHYGDGEAEPEELAEKALELGYTHLCFADKASYLFCEHGRECPPVSEYLERLDALQKKYPKLRIIKGIEVEIEEDGSLAYDTKELEPFDLVIAAVEEEYELSKEKQTERLLKAISHPQVRILAHPTCRIIAQRNGCSLDIEKVIDTAAKEGVWLEIDARPDRLDLSDVHLKAARDSGAHFVLGSVAAKPEEMENIRYGLNQARRGWLEAKHLVNTLEVSEIDKFLKAKK
ncbi:DNA polymerase/3'-5' exonuclease PolX [Nitratifractor salsuginis]|uniref:DNA polymerase beta n=1 Tax=Nitratifractor salsuginis (strain DSM 16511 / JCM 12458 / E9I37-1) TaxID=749222 RepID=E6X370_NITSE|nr:DNA polymerase/3'-5' exonuclease PolX [Nitratifractor salsuginis]ADV46214.1 PHP domain protein [Nitratifractor salsuginis DSM 16511]